MLSSFRLANLESFLFVFRYHSRHSRHLIFSETTVRYSTMGKDTSDKYNRVVLSVSHNRTIMRKWRDDCAILAVLAHNNRGPINRYNRCGCDSCATIIHDISRNSRYIIIAYAMYRYNRCRCICATTPMIVGNVIATTDYCRLCNNRKCEQMPARNTDYLPRTIAN